MAFCAVCPLNLEAVANRRVFFYGLFNTAVPLVAEQEGPSLRGRGRLECLWPARDSRRRAYGGMAALGAAFGNGGALAASASDPGRGRGRRRARQCAWGARRPLPGGSSQWVGRGGARADGHFDDFRRTHEANWYMRRAKTAGNDQMAAALDNMSINQIGEG